jgi:hypothetical protein
MVRHERGTKMPAPKQIAKSPVANKELETPQKKKEKTVIG